MGTFHVTCLADFAKLAVTTLGFYPDESLVVIGLPGGFSTRFDISDADDEMLSVISSALDRSGCDSTVVIQFSESSSTDTLERFVVGLQPTHPVQYALTANRTHVRAMMADCKNELWTPPLEFTRDEVEEAFTGLPDADLLMPLVEEARSRPVSRIAEALWIEQRFAEQQPWSDTDLARLIAAIEDVAVRDALWNQITRADAAAWITKLTALARRAPRQACAPLYGLLAFACWMTGNGVRAYAAARESLAHDPQHRLALLVVEALRHAMPPSEWEPMDPQYVMAQLEEDE